MDSKLDSESCRVLGLEFHRVDQEAYVWEKVIYDQAAAKQRLSLWEKVALGEIKSGDIVKLGDFFGAVTGYHRSLKNQFGVTPANVDQVEALVGHHKEFTLEADGEIRVIRVPNYDDQKIPKMNRTRAFELPKVPEVPIVRAIQEGEPTRLHFFNYKSDPLLKFKVAERMFNHLYDLQAKDFERLLQFSAAFQQYLLDHDPSYKDGLAQPSEADLAYIAKNVKDPKSVKVLSAKVVPALRVSFIEKETRHERVSFGTSMALDLPTPPPTKQIKP
jgi:hypothetical protein